MRSSTEMSNGSGTGAIWSRRMSSSSSVLIPRGRVHRMRSAWDSNTFNAHTALFNLPKRRRTKYVQEKASRSAV